VGGGAVFDRLGSRKTISLAVVGMFLGTLMMILAVTSNSIVILTAGYAAGGFFYGGNVAANSGFISRVYGLRDFAVNSSIANTCVIFSSFVGPYAMGILFTRTGHYVIPYMALLGICCAGFAATRLVKKHYAP
jgi:MFS family permease